MSSIHHPATDTVVTETDILVVGGGIAAMFAACKARELGRDVVLIDKARPGRSGCTALASGVFHFYRRGDDEEAVMRGLTGPLTNHKLFKRTMYQTHEALEFMAAAGVDWVKENGEIVRVGGPRLPFGHSAMMAHGAPQMALALRAETLRRGVRIVERVMVTGLLTSDGQTPTGGGVTGAVGFGTRTGQCHVFRARAVIMATGPAGIPYNRYDKSFYTRAMPIDTGGEGVHAMYECGAVLGKMEMGYRAPGPPEFCNAPGLEMFAALGGHSVWMNALGERFLDESYRKEDFGRSSIMTAILRESFNGRGPSGINLALLRPDQHRLLEQVIPIIMANYKSAGYDMTRETVPYSVGAPAGKGVNGAGARIDENGATSIAGLYAAGNCSDGAYVCLGQALDSCALMGWWAATGAAEYAADQGEKLSAIDWAQVAAFTARHRAPLKVDGGLRFEQVRDKLTALQITLTPTYNQDNIVAAISALRQICEEDLPRLTADTPRDLAKVASLKPAVPVMELVLAVMEHRKESRGNLIRDDYAYTDNRNWLNHTMVQRDGSRYRVWDAQVPADWQVFDPPTNVALHPLFK